MNVPTKFLVGLFGVGLLLLVFYPLFPYYDVLHIKLAIILLLAIAVKLVFSVFILPVYKKARETATGAGMVLISLSLIVLALLNFLTN